MNKPASQHARAEKQASLRWKRSLGVCVFPEIDFRHARNRREIVVSVNKMRERIRVEVFIFLGSGAPLCQQGQRARSYCPTLGAQGGRPDFPWIREKEKKKPARGRHRLDIVTLDGCLSIDQPFWLISRRPHQFEVPGCAPDVIGYKA